MTKKEEEILLKHKEEFRERLGKKIWIE
jgi:hypothetical protein